MLRVLDLFSGIGGFSLGLERTGGFKTVAFCEIDPFCRRVLANHWPGVKQYDDIRTLSAKSLRRIGTYTLPQEGGASLRGAGWRLIGERGGGSWDRDERPRVDKHPTQSKLLWERT